VPNINASTPENLRHSPGRISRQSRWNANVMAFVRLDKYVGSCPLCLSLQLLVDDRDGRLLVRRKVRQGPPEAFLLAAVTKISISLRLELAPAVGTISLGVTAEEIAAQSDIKGP